MSNIDQEFDSIADEINAKIREAALALKQANEIAKKHGLKTLHRHQHLSLKDYGVNTSDDTENDLHIEVIDRIAFRPLLNEMDSAGWCSSGFEC